MPARATGSRVRHVEALWDMRGMEDEDGNPWQEGVCVHQFPGSRQAARNIAGFQGLGSPVLVEVDDDYTRPAQNEQTSTWQRYDNPQDRASYEVHRTIVRELADGVVVSTPVLADVYRKLNPNVFVCPNGVMPEDWPEPEPRDDVFRIGWSGSVSHMYDLSLIERALDWASRQRDVEVVVLGGLPFKHRQGIRGTGVRSSRTGYEVGEFVWGDDKFPHTHLPWTDTLADYRQALVSARIDLGLCPLKRSPWNDGKSDLKALEYAIAGGCPAVSNSPAYGPWQEWPLVADDETGWRKIVKWAVEHRDNVRGMAATARERVLRERSMSVLAQHWEEAFQSVETTAGSAA